jgi:hypothetical protein
MEPVYNLPSAMPAIPPQEVKFLRNSLDITDIEGTRPKKDPWYNKKRNIDPYTEVEGSRTKAVKIFKDFVDKSDVTEIIAKKS